MCVPVMEGHKNYTLKMAARKTLKGIDATSTAEAEFDRFADVFGSIRSFWQHNAGQTIDVRLTIYCLPEKGAR